MGGSLSSLLFALMLLGAGCSTSGAPVAANGYTPAIVQDDSKRVLVVVNEASTESVEVGGYYIAKRKIPKENVLRVRVTTAENISMEEFEAGLRKRVRSAVLESKNPIDFVVLTKGVPIRLVNDNGHSVDGHIAVMDLPIKAIEQPVPEQVRNSINPYFNKNESFSRARYGMVLVTRLDGLTVADCKRLVDNSVAATPSKGPFFFDAAENRREAAYGDTQMSLTRATNILKTKGFDASLDDTPAFVAPSGLLAGYTSWGSNDGQFDPATYARLRFKPGALAETFVSTSGRTFRPTTGGQSLITVLIAAGVTGVKGYVSEPFTFALAKPEILFDRYTSGFNLAESFYMASLVVKWKDVVIGDPLCRPYPPR